MLAATVEVDYSDAIPLVHEDGAQFVCDKDMEFLGLKGKYTGWWQGEMANGRGTWRDKDGLPRIDAVWKDGCLNGRGRKMFNADLYEGTWSNNGPAEDKSVKMYNITSGNVVIKSLKKGVKC